MKFYIYGEIFNLSFIGNFLILLGLNMLWGYLGIICYVLFDKLNIYVYFYLGDEKMRVFLWFLVEKV